MLNLIFRVIYDTKWFDPPVQIIRDQLYKTDLNEAIIFLVNNIFLRFSRYSKLFRFDLDLDPDLPAVQINELVVWELLKPIIRNSINHSNAGNPLIKIKTK